MTFRPETNPKDCGDDRRRNEPSDGDTANVQQRQHPASNISTIYNPSTRCPPRYPASTGTTNIPVFTPVHQLPLFYPKKSLIEKIKKISHKLHSANQHSSDASQLDEAQKRMRLIKYMCLAVLLASYIVVMVCAWIFMYSPMEATDRRSFIVDGEFQILNREFEAEMLDKESLVFKELALNVSYELDRLFKYRRTRVGDDDNDGMVTDCYQRNEVLEITPNMTVKSIVGFKNCDKNVNVGRIGLVFLRGLRLRHGHTFLGHHFINVQSIGFTVRGEEGVWGEWSDWRGCESPDDHVAKRTRRCLTRDTFQVTNVDRCLLIPGNKGDLDIVSCSEYRMIRRKQVMDEIAKTLFINDFDDSAEHPLTVSIEDDFDGDRL